MNLLGEHQLWKNNILTLMDQYSLLLLNHLHSKIWLKFQTTSYHFFEVEERFTVVCPASRKTFASFNIRSKWCFECYHATGELLHRKIFVFFLRYFDSRLRCSSSISLQVKAIFDTNYLLTDWDSRQCVLATPLQKKMMLLLLIASRWSCESQTGVINFDFKFESVELGILLQLLVAWNPDFSNKEICKSRQQPL